MAKKPEVVGSWPCRGSANIWCMRFFAIALPCLALPYGGHGADHPSASFANEQVEAPVYGAAAGATGGEAGGQPVRPDGQPLWRGRDQGLKRAAGARGDHRYQPAAGR